jgi:uncharacterized protein (DUF2236 family)
VSAGRSLTMSVTKRINAERLMLLAWPRAILLQIAHPLIGAGVADHSTVRDGPLAAARRLRHVVRAMLALTFGTPEAHAAAIGRIRAQHRLVHGQLREAAGPFPAGTRYSAEDPALVLWVHATLIESVVLAFEALIAPLSEQERDAYCAETAWVPIALGAHGPAVPRSWAALVEYVASVYASGAIVVTDDARALAAAVLAPRLAVMTGPLAPINRIVTRGLLPPDVRRQYGFAWTPADARHLARVMRLLRRTRRWLPRVLAIWPEARSQSGSELVSPAA